MVVLVPGRVVDERARPETLRAGLAIRRPVRDDELHLAVQGDQQLLLHVSVRRVRSVMSCED